MITPRLSSAPRLSSLLLPRAYRIALVIAPPLVRSDWSREWHAELWHLRRKSSADWPHPFSLARGMLSDALWLRADSIRSQSHGSACLCLISLSAACFILALAEFFFVGSFQVFRQTVTYHLLGNYLPIALPSIFAAVITHPLRSVRRQSSQSFEELISIRICRTLFLATRITLTLALGFFTILFLLSPFHFAGRTMIGFAELLLDAVTITASLRYVLLNQEQRCQRCLRVLGLPTRVGSPSHNFLYWSGTERACADGHGMLRVPALRGSWCWYDRWVEDDSSWLLATSQP